ncbi:hypothetical protein HDU98_006159 [Podochytrium sp. JEL0797]|nr:hypothetical protein HDU98_006159 [Podochytrium sp. JEL0797]
METFRHISTANRRSSGSHQNHHQQWNHSSESTSRIDSLALILLAAALLVSTMILVNDGIVASYSTQTTTTTAAPTPPSRSSRRSPAAQREPVVARIRRAMTFRKQRSATALPTQSSQRLGAGNLGQEDEENNALLREMFGLEGAGGEASGVNREAMEDSSRESEALDHVEKTDQHVQDEQDETAISAIQQLDEMADDDDTDALAETEESEEEDASSSSLDEFSDLDEDELFVGVRGPALTSPRLDAASVLSGSHASLLSNEQIELEAALVDEILMEQQPGAMNVDVGVGDALGSGTADVVRRRRMLSYLPRLTRSSNATVGNSATSPLFAATGDGGPTWRAATSRRLRQIPRRIRRNVGSVANATTAAGSLVAVGAVLLLAVLWVIKIRGWSWLPRFWQLVTRRGTGTGGGNAV